MAERKIIENLLEAWRLFRLWLWLKWILLFRRQPRDTYQTITIDPEGIRIKSFAPNEVHRTTRSDGTVVTYLHSHWDGEAYFAFVGMCSRFYISVSDSKPGESQLEFLRTLLRREQSFRHALAVEMFKHYQEHVYKKVDFCERKGGETTYIPAPAVESPAALDKTVYAAFIYLSDDDAAEGQFIIELKCDLDVVLQSFTLTVKDWRIVKVD
jgi:hypothetical protein